MYTPPGAPYYGGAPPLSMGLPPVRAGVDSVGLGFWTALVPVASSLISGALQGDGSMSAGEYYPAARRGEVFCPGPYNVDQIEAALAAQDPSDASVQQLRRDIETALRKDGEWVKSYPATPREMAGALVAWAHGGRDCTVQANEAALRGLLDRILALEEQRQRTLAERAQQAAASAASVAAPAIAQVQTQLAQVQTALDPVIPRSVQPLAAVTLGIGLYALYKNTRR